jgi:hypothetical protein
VTNSDRQKLIQRARELNTTDFSVIELKERIREVCVEYLIEAKVDVNRLLKHQDSGVRSMALKIVWWGLGETDGIDQSVEILMKDPDEDIRAYAAFVLYQAARNTPKEARVREAFRIVSDNLGTSDYVRDAAQRYLQQLNQGSRIENRLE